MKTAIVYLLVASVLLTPIAAMSQRPTVPAKTPVAAAPAQAVTNLEPTAKSRFLATAWESGTLPAPMRPATIQFEDKEGQIYMLNAQQGKAEAYVKAINAGNENSLPAVVGATLQAGYGITTSDNQTQKWTGGQGMNIPDYEVAAMAKSYGQGQSTSLKSFVKGFTVTFKPFRDMAFEDMLLQCIRDAERSSVPEVVFWANMIAELGKQSANPYDIFDENIDHNRIRLDPIQRQLIMMRLAGDIALAQQARVARTGRSYQDIYQKAAYRTSTSRAPADSPCELSNMQGVMADNTAMAATSAFGRIAAIVDEYVGMLSGSSMVGDYLRRAGFANILLNVLKFVATYAALEIKISMDGDTLTRTKTRAPGERKQVMATVKLNTGKWSQLATCARPFLNLVGLDFSLPNAGAVSNAKVTFVLQEDENMGGAEAIFHNGNAGNFFGDGNTTYSDPVGNVRIEPVTKQETFTDDQGVAKVNIIGEAQNEDLSRRKLTGNQNRLGISAFVQLKATDPKNLADDPSRWSGTIMDYLGPIASLLSGDELGAAVGAATETLYRTSWYSSDVFPFTVKDWKPCGECWAGTFSETTVTTSKTNDTTNGTTRVSSYTKTTTVTFTVTVDDSGNAATNATVNATENSSNSGSGPDICSDDRNARFSDSMVKTDTASGGGPAFASISVDGANVSIYGSTGDIARKIAVEDKRDDACTPGGIRKSRTTNSDWNLTDKYIVHFNGSGVPTRPNTAHGTLAIPNPLGSTTYKWDLERK